MSRILLAVVTLGLLASPALAAGRKGMTVKPAERVTLGGFLGYDGPLRVLRGRAPDLIAQRLSTHARLFRVPGADWAIQQTYARKNGYTFELLRVSSRDRISRKQRVGATEQRIEVAAPTAEGLLNEAAAARTGKLRGFDEIVGPSAEALERGLARVLEAGDPTLKGVSVKLSNPGFLVYLGGNRFEAEVTARRPGGRAVKQRFDVVPRSKGKGAQGYLREAWFEDGLFEALGAKARIRNGARFPLDL